MRSIISIKIIIYCLLISICSTNTQWVAQYSPSSINLQDVTFINRYTGWVCGDGSQILKTTNGGVSWILQNSGVTGKILTGIHAVDSQYVYCVGWWQTILKTTNGGNNWIIIRNGPQPAIGSFYGIFFLNRTTGWMLRNEYVLRTTNGGNTFDSTHIDNGYLYDIYFKDALTGVICGEVSGIYKSTNGGIVWNQISIPTSGGDGSPDFFKISFVGNSGWVVGRASNQQSLGHKVFRTTNFGNNWDSIGRVPMVPGTETYCCYFSSLNTGWSGGSYGHIFKTTNGGFNWYQQVVPTQWFRRSMYFYNDSIGWAVGGFGEILFTTTSGQYVDVKKISNNIPNESKLYPNYPNPFNSQTNIEFKISVSDMYELSVYDILGRKVEELLNEYKTPGAYKINYHADKLSSGTYFYRLSSSKINLTNKFILIK